MIVPNTSESSREALPRPEGCAFLTLRQCPERMDAAADWFHSKWGVPKEAYLACMRAYLGGETARPSTAGICAWMGSGSWAVSASSKTIFMTGRI